MTSLEPKSTAAEPRPSEVVSQAVNGIAKSEGFTSKIYQAISVQRPVVLEYLKSLRREKPDANVEEILRRLERRYIATVTATSTGVGASAAIPGVGIPLALGLGVADLLFYYETSALYILAAAELHGIEVSDTQRAQPLIFGILLGKKSQNQVTKLVLHASGAGSVEHARTIATGTVSKALPNGWGEVLTQQLPDSALAPVATVIAREALKNSTKLGAGTLGKAIPLGLGAVIGGAGSFAFARDVIKAAHVAFPVHSVSFPDSLLNFEGKKRALTATKRAGSAVKSVAVGTAGTVGSLFKRKREIDTAEAPNQAGLDTAEESE